MKTVMTGLFGLAALPAILAHLTYATLCAALATFGYTVLMGSPFIAMGFLAITFHRKSLS